MTMRWWLLLPARVWVLAFILAPLAIVAAYSFLSPGDYAGVEYPWTGENYQRATDSLYLAILWRSLWIAGLATAICALLGFPLALFIARAERRKNLYLQLVLLPFWTSFLVRTYAWLFILRDTGLLNTLLLKLHLISQPVQFLYNDGAVLLGLVYNFLPFFVLPVYAVLERLDRSVIEAAGDLGATPLRALLRVVIPLSGPGIAAGCVLVFIPCLGAYLTPDLLGGGKSVMIGNLIQNQFTTARNWPFGAAISMALIMVSALALMLLGRSKAARESL